MQRLVSMIAITTIIGIKRSCSQSSGKSRLVDPIVFIIILVKESRTDSIIIRLPIGLPRGNCYWAILGPALIISNQATSHQFKKKSPKCLWLCWSPLTKFVIDPSYEAMPHGHDDHRLQSYLPIIVVSIIMIVATMIMLIHNHHHLQSWPSSLQLSSWECSQEWADGQSIWSRGSSNTVPRTKWFGHCKHSLFIFIILQEKLKCR